MGWPLIRLPRVRAASICICPGLVQSWAVAFFPAYNNCLIHICCMHMWRGDILTPPEWAEDQNSESWVGWLSRPRQYPWADEVRLWKQQEVMVAHSWLGADCPGEVCLWEAGWSVRQFTDQLETHAECPGGCRLPVAPTQARLAELMAWQAGRPGFNSPLCHLPGTCLGRNSDLPFFCDS